MKKIFLSAFLAVAGFLGANAEALSPEEALARVGNIGQMPSKVRSLTTQNPELKSTINMPDGEPGVYLFEKNNTWMVVSADTRAAALLGYGEGENLGEIPPAMQYWMDFYAREMASVPDVAYTAAPASRADRANIDPMLKTTWDQQAPFNDQCPILGGLKSLTGCVATAMAQVAKYHRWPTKGVGSNTYTYQYGNQNFTESFDFANTTFDYDSMLDNYLGSYNTTQAQAVATLMKACGVAGDMMYSPYSSGTTDILAGAGMVAYMNYSIASSIEQRDWYYISEWNELVYNQLAEGMPVPYGGATAKQEGHEFVCDGYKDGYFHINWGWSGLSDGYFLLSSLNPNTQGSGGASSNMAFNYQQSIVSNLRPPKAGDKLNAQIWADSFATGVKSYTRVSGSSIVLKGGFNSVSTSELTNLTIGVQCVDVNDANNVVFAGNSSISSLLSGYRFISYGVNTMSIPVGTWKVLPAFKFNGEWYAMRYNPTTQAPMIFTVTEDKITIESGTPVPDPDILSFTSAFKGWNTNELVIGETAKFTFDVVSNMDTKVTMQPLLLDASSNMKSRATAQEVSLTANQPKSLEFSIKFPNSLKTNTTYYLVNTYVDTESASYVIISDPVSFKVVTKAGIDAIDVDGVTVVKTYDLQGRPVMNPSNGIYLQRMSDGTIKRVFIR